MLSNSTKIIVRDFTLPARIGIYPSEKVTKQPICLNVTMTLENYKISHDTIEDTVSYEAIVEEIRRRSDIHHNLVETLAEELAAFCLQDKRVNSVDIQIEKTDVFKEGKVGCLLYRMQNQKT